MICIASDLIGFCSVYAPFDYLYKKTLAKFIHICNYVHFFFLAQVVCCGSCLLVSVVLLDIFSDSHYTYKVSLPHIYPISLMTKLH